MAVYWVDPYIDCNAGGIHGTTDSTSRSGTYSAPWGLYDIYTSNSNFSNTIQGTTLQFGDEIRLKGQAQNLFCFQDRDADLGIASIASGAIYIDQNNTTDRTYLAAAQSAYSAKSFTVPLIMYKDTGKLGDHDFFLFSGNTSFTNTNDYTIPTYLNDRSPWRALYYAKNPRSGMSLPNDTVGIIDPDYFFDIRTDLTTTSTFFCNIPVYIFITDGWDTQTTQNGVTILPMMNNSTTGGTQYIKQYNNNYTYDQIPRLDLGNTFWIRFNATGSYTGGSTYVRAERMGDYTASTPSVDTWIKFGQVSDMTGDAWGYMYMDGQTKTPSGNPYVIDIENYSCPRYGYMYAYTSQNYKPKVRIQNVYQSAGLYYSGAWADITFGNYLAYRDYTGGFAFANVTSNTNIRFMDNAHVYTHNGAAAFSGGTVLGTNLGTITNGIDGSTAYPGQVSGGGPAFGVVLSSKDPAYSGFPVVKLKPSYWLEGAGINAPGNSNIFGTWNAQNHRAIIGLADSDSGNTDYRNLNVKIYTKRQTYDTAVTWAESTPVLMGNNFDGQPIEIIPAMTSNTSNYQMSAIGYNDSNGNYVIQFADYGSTLSVKKTFEAEVPSGLTSTGTLTFTIDVDCTNTNMSQGVPQAYIYSTHEVDGNYHVLAFTAKADGSGYTGTTSISGSKFSSHIKYFPYTIRVDALSTADYTLKFTIKDPTITVT